MTATEATTVDRRAINAAVRKAAVMGWKHCDGTAMESLERFVTALACAHLQSSRIEPAAWAFVADAASCTELATAEVGSMLRGTVGPKALSVALIGACKAAGIEPKYDALRRWLVDADMAAKFERAQALLFPDHVKKP
jgi:hypothetical protein